MKNGNEPTRSRGLVIPPTPLEEVGNRLRSMRKRNGLSQRQLAALANTTQRTIALIENAKANPTIELLDKISKPLDLEPKVTLVRRPIERIL